MKKIRNFILSVFALVMVFGMTVFAATEVEPNNGKSAATKIAVETKATGELQTNDDVDWYCFDITKQGYFTLEFGYDDTKNAKWGWDITIYQGDTIICGYDGYAKCHTYKLPYGPGTYYVRVKANHTYDWYCPYNVEYNFTIHETENASWEQESNGTRKTATPIPADTKTINAIINRNDSRNSGDVFSFELAERSMVDISLVLDATLTSEELSNGLDIYLYKFDEESARLTREGITIDTTTSVALPAGKYVIFVLPRSDNYGICQGAEYTISYKAEKTNVYEEFDREGEKFKTNTDDYTFYEDNKGNVYCYDATGAPVINQFACDGEYTYYFQADRTAMKDRLTYHPDGVHVIYFDQYGHEVFSDYANVKKTISGDAVNDFCFFNVFGYLYVDVLTWDKNGKELLYANPYGVLERNGWFQFSNNVIWADGTPCEGIAGQYGYGQKSGYLLRNKSTKDWNGNPVYLQGNGVAKW